MISTTCKCGGELWVRDRLAGQPTQCPSCKGQLVIPTLETVRATMASARCACGEVFWAPSWRAGRKCRCPLCGEAVGEGSAAEAATQADRESQPARKAAPRNQAPAFATATPRTGGGKSSSAQGGETPTTASRLSDPRVLAGVASVVALISLAAAVGMWLGGRNEANQAENPPATVTTIPEPSGGAPIMPEATVAVAAPAAPIVTPAPAAIAPPTVGSGPVAPNPAGNGIKAEPAAALASTLRLVVPAYFYPAGEGLKDWERLGRAAAEVPVVAIANPSSGPGDKRNSEYSRAIAAATRAGVTVVGYINTDYGKRPRVEVEAELSRWLEFYPEIKGFFLDSHAPDASAENLDYYQKLREFAERWLPDALVIANPGTLCDREFLEKPTTDIAILFENSKDFDSFELPAWGADLPAGRFAVLPYNIPDAAAMRQCLQGAVIKGVGNLYVTSGTAINPWGALPAYWEEEVEMIKKINEHRGL